MEKNKSIKKAGIFGIVGNIFLLIIKATVGFLCNSQSMIADTLNSAGDIFASLMTFIGNKIASIPQDKDHNFGHGKAEYIFSMFISISMILVSSKLLFDSVITLIYGSKLTFTWFLIIVCIITIITKFGLYLYTYSLNSILLKSNMKDHRNDCIITTFTLISILLTLIGIYFVDGIVGILISIWICYTGITIFIESYNVLMDISVDETTKNTISNICASFTDIRKVNDLSSTPAGDKHIIFLNISVDGNITTFASHKLADTLEKQINQLANVYKTIIHVEPE